MFERFYKTIENKRKEVREGQYRVQIYKYHPKAAEFVRKLILVTAPIVILLIAIMFISPIFFDFDPETESNPVILPLFGLMVLFIGFAVLNYWLVSPPSCLTVFEEKLDGKNHHDLIQILYKYLNLVNRETEVNLDIFPIETKIHTIIIDTVTTVLNNYKDQTVDFEGYYNVFLNEDESVITLTEGNFPLTASLKIKQE